MTGHPETKYKRGQNKSDRMKDHPLVEGRASVATRDKVSTYR